MEIKAGNYCPLIKKECMKLQCAWFTKISGYDVNTGKDVDEWHCAINLLPMLLVENSGQQRQTGAAVESFRNEMVKANQDAQDLMKAQMLLAARPEKKEKLLKIIDNEDEVKLLGDKE